MKYIYIHNNGTVVITGNILTLICLHAMLWYEKETHLFVR
jgi:hypothetical protein